MSEQARFIRRLRRLARKHGFLLRKYRGQWSPGWDLVMPETGGVVFAGPCNGYCGVCLDVVEEWLTAEADHDPF
jgi:hypothetical protein